MKKIFFGIMISFFSISLVNAADLTCYYSQEKNGGSNPLDNIIVEVNKDGTIKSYVDSSSVAPPTVDNSHITFKELLKENETKLSCPSSLYTEIPGLPANTYNIYFQYDQSVFLLDSCDNEAFCFYGILNTEKSTPDVSLTETPESSFNCEYKSNGALVGTNNARILYSVVDGVPFFSVKGGETKFKITAVDGFEVASDCEEQGSLYIQCHLGNNQCKIANSKSDLTNAVQAKVEITLVGKEEETIPDGDEIEEDNESHKPQDRPKIGFSPTKLCESEENCNIDLDGFCAMPTVSRTLRFLGLLFSIVKILVPAIIIIMGIVNLIKIITSGKEEEVKKSVKSIGMRVIIGVGIFLLPGIVKFIFTTADDIISRENASTFKNCYSCILSPDSEDCIVTTYLED